MNIKIVFETQTGATQYVAEVIRDNLQAAGHTVALHSVKYDGQQPSLEGFDVLLFGGPTYDDGKLEKNLREFITNYQPDLSQYKVAVFGLGNRTYPQFCVSADILEDWVKERGGTPLTEALRVDGFPDHLEKIKEYVDRLLVAIQ
jgi:flavodoxin I